VLRKDGAALVTVAESQPVQVEVGLPQLSLRAEPTAPYPGQEVRVTVTEQPALGPQIVSFWWEVAGNARNAGALADERHYSFKPGEATPVTVTVHAKARDGAPTWGSRASRSPRGVWTFG